MPQDFKTRSATLLVRPFHQSGSSRPSPKSGAKAPETPQNQVRPTPSELTGVLQQGRSTFLGITRCMGAVVQQVGSRFSQNQHVCEGPPIGQSVHALATSCSRLLGISIFPGPIQIDSSKVSTDPIQSDSSEVSTTLRQGQNTQRCW